MTLVKPLSSRAITGVLSLAMALWLLAPMSSHASSQRPNVPNISSDTLSAAGAKAHSSPAAVRNPLGYAPNELLVKLNGQGSGALAAPGLQGAMQCFGLRATEEIAPGEYKLSAQPGILLDVNAAASYLRGSACVMSAEPNHYYYTQAAPNDEQYVAGQQWGITQIKSEQAWDVTTGSPDVVVAVLDTGAALGHPDLSDKIVAGYDFANNDGDPSDDEGHGTMTAGIIGASTNNGIGVAGVSWGSRLMPIKVCTSQGRCSDDAIAQGLRWAVDHGARIVNASLGGDEDSQVMRDAVQYANDHNVLLVAAAGNTPDGKTNYPAAYDGVLSVGATGRSDTYTGFSSFGSYVGVTAPGVGILSTGYDNGRLTYEYGNGTSFSSPFVAGLAALVLSANPSLTASQVRDVILATSDDLGDPGPDVHYGAGRVNAFRAVTQAKQGPVPPRTATPLVQPTRAAAPTATQPAVPPTATAPVSQSPTLQLDSTTVQGGALLAITGTGFGQSELIQLSLLTADSLLKPLGSAQTGTHGEFTAEVALPPSLQAGKAVLSATGSSSGRVVAVQLTIQPGSAAGQGQSVVKGLIKGATSAGIVVKLKPAIGASGPELQSTVDINGAYSFTNLAGGIYSLTVTAPGSQQAGPLTVQVDGSANDVKTIDVTLTAGRPAAFDRVAPAANSSTQVYFPPVGHMLKGPFLRFWQANGGLAVFGYPLSEEYLEVSQTDGKTYTVQYFERNRFELHPEFAGTSNEVLMGLLGVQVTRNRLFAGSAPFQSDATHVYFSQTQHSLSGAFLKYWQQHGGLAIFGYPISEPITENGASVQYFERNRFELHPEFAGTSNEVLLGLLGVEVARSNGWVTP